MFFRKLLVISAFAGTLAASVWVCIPPASSGSPSVGDEARYQPLQSISYDFGSKSTTGYFERNNGACFVVLMVAEHNDPDAPLPLSPTRVRLTLYPGQIAGFDSEEGRSLNFTCGEAAATVLVTSGGRDRLVKLQNATHVQTAAGSE